MQRLLPVLARFESRQSCALPRLLVLTDDARGFSLTTQMRIWPAGAAFIERTFGQSPTPIVPTKSQPIQMATCNPKQARRAGRNGIHWPHGRLRFRHRSALNGLIETASAHNGLEIAKARSLGITAVLVSTAFRSQSPTARKALGAIRLARLAQSFPDCCLYALGGVTAKQARLLKSTGVYGIALVSGSSR